MDSTYEVVESAEGVVVFAHNPKGEEFKSIEVLDDRPGGAWLPKKSRVLALVDFEHRRVTFLNGATENYPYGRQIYYYDLNADRGEVEHYPYHPTPRLGEYIKKLFRDWEELKAEDEKAFSEG